MTEWKTVPVEPTPEMLAAGEAAFKSYALRWTQGAVPVWEAMLAASPPPVDDNDAKDEALHKIAQWAKAYPLDVFPEPDLRRAREVLEAAGMTLDSISAYAMRHVITKVQEIADAALAKEPRPC